MDQVKIGRFIAECRKKENMTQVQLADKLGITDRAVSKWERGLAMPDSSIMMELCELLNISVNDLLSGEIVSENDYKRGLEENLMDAIKRKEESDRQLLRIEWILTILSLVILFLPIVIALLLPLEENVKTIISFCGFIPAIFGLGFAIRIEQVAGYYECSHCSHKYVPTFAAVSFAAHIGRTRYMKCPYCGNNSWQKKIISKGEDK